MKLQVHDIVLADLNRSVHPEMVIVLEITDTLITVRAQDGYLAFIPLSNIYPLI